MNKIISIFLIFLLSSVANAGDFGLFDRAAAFSAGMVVKTLEKSAEQTYEDKAKANPADAGKIRQKSKIAQDALNKTSANLFDKALGINGDDNKHITNNKNSVEKYSIGPYNKIKGAIPGLDAHHVGQKALMMKMIPEYNPETAPAILIPREGHTVATKVGVVSRQSKGLNNPREVVARDIKELRRVYPDIPNQRLQELVKNNKELYNKHFIKRIDQ